MGGSGPASNLLSQLGIDMPLPSTTSSNKTQQSTSKSSQKQQNYKQNQQYN